MGVKVKNLKVALQNGTTNTLYASWEFNTQSANTTTTKASSTIKKNTVVKINSGAKYYNGATVPSWVISRQWIVMDNPVGDRVVINKSTDGQYAICSPISSKYLTVVSGGSSGSSSSSTVKESNLEHYEVKWEYYTDGDVWFTGTTSNTKDKSSVWSFPSNASLVRVKVTPISKKYTPSGSSTEVSHWTAEASSVSYTVYNGKPENVSAPSVTIDKYTLTATLDGITDGKASAIEFFVVKDNQTSAIATGETSVVNQRATFTCSVSAGGKYRVKCRAINIVSGNNKTYGEWSTFSSEDYSIPSSISNLKCVADSETSVKLTWTGTTDAKSYDISYTTKKEYFDSANEVSSMTVENTTAYVTGLESGDEWFFRVRAKNDKGESGWSNIVSTIIGTEPEPPTTWSLSTTAIVGDTVILYWVHNTEDGSKQTEAQIELTVNGVPNTVTVKTNTDENEEEKTYSHTLDLSQYPEGAKVLWRVRTKGIINKFSDWSIQRTIDIYAPAIAELTLDTDYTNGTLTMFPLGISVTTSPITQIPMSYHVAVKATQSYETLDYTGELIRINPGQEVYSKAFATSSNPFALEISAGDVVLVNNQTYEVEVTASMDSGLLAVANSIFTVNWSDDLYNPDASVAINRKSLCAYITPFCVDDDGDYIPDVLLSVYRRTHNGEFIEIGKDIVNNGATSITDPHPSLNIARYRVVARNKNTSVIGYSDLSGTPVNEPGIIIQWDEAWTSFNYELEAEPVNPSWTGSFVRLLYNVDTSENYDRDVSLVEYIGRKNPVGYYGTQRGEAAMWSTEIPKYDEETIYALRRLAIWDGDVYVREPSGVGYWAQISISMSFKHMALTVPVTINVKRVEGGGI